MTKKKKPNNMPQTAINQEFKETAIKLALAGDKPISQVATRAGNTGEKPLQLAERLEEETRGQHHCQEFGHQIVLRRGVAQAPEAQSRA
jgi:transposase-like protein